MKSFSELFINKYFEYTFVTFEYEQTILRMHQFQKYHLLKEIKKILYYDIMS